MTAGFVGWVKPKARSRCPDLQAVDEELRVERGRDKTMPLRVAFDGFGGLSVVALAARDQLALGEGQAVLRSATMTYADGLEQRVAIDDLPDRRLGEEYDDGRVVAVHEGRGGAATPGGEADEDEVPGWDSTGRPRPGA